HVNASLVCCTGRTEESVAICVIQPLEEAESERAIEGLRILPERFDCRFDAANNFAVLGDCVFALRAKHLFLHIQQWFVLLGRSVGLREHEFDFFVSWKIHVSVLGTRTSAAKSEE